MIMDKLKYLFLLILFTLLFVSGPDSPNHRVYQEFWDTGHLVLFAGLALVLLNLPMLQTRASGVQLAAVLILAIAVGGAIEVIQLVVGRSLELKDLYNDVLGAVLGFMIYLARQQDKPMMMRIAMYPLMLLTVVLGLKSLAYVVIDDYIGKQDFPVLADFETPFELSRWDTNLARLSYSTSYVRYGEKAMKIEFLPGRYPDIALKDFPADWQGFSLLKFSIFNTRSQPVMIKLKIYDWQHVNSGSEYSDRFNKELELEPGWNDIVIDLEKVRAAPAYRQMEMSRIANFSLFLDGLSAPMDMYLDSLHLFSG